MPHGKKFVIQELSDALSVEKAIVENERVLEALGQKPVKVEPDDRKVLNALRKAVQDGEERAERLSAHRLLEAKAVEAAEIFHAVSEHPGKPATMKPVDINLPEDKRHAKRLHDFMLQLAPEEATSGSGLEELGRAAQ